MDTEQRLTIIEARVKALENSITVGGYTQAQHERYMADHAEWLQAHDKAILEARKRDKVLGERIQALVSGIGELISKLPPVK